MSAQTPTSSRLDRQSAALFLVAALLFLFHAVRLRHDLQLSDYDLNDFFLPWLNHVLSFGRLPSLEASFSNYSPPYIYLLSLGSLFHGMLSGKVIVKLLSLPFVLFAGWLGFDICLALNLSRTRALAIGALIMLSPEVWSNGFAWGQCDIIYTCLLLATWRLLLARRPAAAMAIFGSALAFKLQAIFFGPVLLALLFTGEIAVWQLLLIPAAYLLWMVPAALAGRPWKEILFVYASQYDFFSKLSMHAPNPLFFLQPFIAPGHVDLVSRVCILLAAIVSLLAVARYLRRTRTQTAPGLLAMATFCLLVEPYLLPRMHDRYFYPGDVFAILLMAVRPRMAVAVILLQTCAYLLYQQ